jgi:hypothetical protein
MAAGLNPWLNNGADETTQRRGVDTLFVIYAARVLLAMFDISLYNLKIQLNVLWLEIDYFMLPLQKF